MKNLSKEEITEMNAMMKQLENDVEEMRGFRDQLEAILDRYHALQKFTDEKWLQYYDDHENFSNVDLEILNQDSLYNATSDAYAEAKELLKTAVKFL